MSFLPVEVEGAGPPLVLVPGFACAPNVWFKVRGHLATSFELHMVTVPGFGGTRRLDPPVIPQVIDALGNYCAGLNRPVLLGHSFGGTLTFGVAARNPEELRGAMVVDGLPYFATVFDVNATPDSMQERAQQRRNEIANAPPPSPGGRTYFDEHIIDPKDAAYMNETTPSADRTAMADVGFEGMITDLRPEMPKIKVPVLMMGAGQPWIKSPEDLAGVRRWYLDRLDEIPDLELLIAERARHFVMIDDPDWFLEKVTDFVVKIA